MHNRDVVLDVLAATILRRYLAMPELGNHSLDTLIGMARGTAHELLSEGEPAPAPGPQWTSYSKVDSTVH